MFVYACVFVGGKGGGKDKQFFSHPPRKGNWAMVATGRRSCGTQDSWDLWAFSEDNAGVGPHSAGCAWGPVGGAALESALRGLASDSAAARRPIIASSCHAAVRLRRDNTKKQKTILIEKFNPLNTRLLSLSLSHFRTSICCHTFALQV